MVDRARIETHYLASEASLSELLRSLPSDELDAPVPACPGWSVLDVLRHVVGITEDAAAGKLGGVPDDEQTAAQIASRADRGLDDLLTSWDALAPTFASNVAANGVWPAAIDVATHEHDVRHAVDRPGDRDGDVVRDLSDVLAGGMVRQLGLRIETPTGSRGDDDADLTLRTTAFELFRLRMGRRSRAQLESLDWVGDPTPVLDDVCAFGPSPVDIEE